jgi:hypothetical protein
MVAQPCIAKLVRIATRLTRPAHCCMRSHRASYRSS